MCKILYLILLTCLVSCSNNIPTIKTGLEGKALPSFHLLLRDSTTHFSTASIPIGSPTVMIFFSPNCPYCRAETEAIVNNMNSMKNINFYFFSNFPLSMIKDYCKKYDLGKFSNVIVAQDFESFFGNYYKVEAVPYIAVFNKNRILNRVLIGDVGTDIIKEVAFQ